VTSSPSAAKEYDVSCNIYTTSSYKCVLEVGNSVKDKSDSIRFLVLCQSWILGGSPVPPGYAYVSLNCKKQTRNGNGKDVQHYMKPDVIRDKQYNAVKTLYTLFLTL